MLYAGLDLSRQRLDVHLMDEDGSAVEVTAVRPDAGALRTLASTVSRCGQAVTAVVESMNGTRFHPRPARTLGLGYRGRRRAPYVVASYVREAGPLGQRTEGVVERALILLNRVTNPQSRTSSGCQLRSIGSNPAMPLLSKRSSSSKRDPDRDVIQIA